MEYKCVICKNNRQYCDTNIKQQYGTEQLFDFFCVSIFGVLSLQAFFFCRKAIVADFP